MIGFIVDDITNPSSTGSSGIFSIQLTTSLGEDMSTD